MSRQSSSNLGLSTEKKPWTSLQLGPIRLTAQVFLTLWITAGWVGAQTTAFSYQGQLKKGGAPANGAHDFRFKLFENFGEGHQRGNSLEQTNVLVTNGVFTVELDFGTFVFSDGADLVLEIGVRLPGETNYDTLAPRQRLRSSPYSIQTLNASQLGGVPWWNYVQTTDARLSDTRPPSGTAGGDLAGSYPNPTIASNSITSGKIADGSIMNADINNAAAISATKISGLGSLAGVTPTGSASSSTYLRGDNTWANPTPQIATAFINASYVPNGTGITVSHLSAGRYQITYSPAFANTPSLIICPAATTTPFYWNEILNNHSGVLIQFRRSDGTAADPGGGFWILAIQRSF